jgi:dTDP-4-dehydrorhamnose reductase
VRVAVTGANGLLGGEAVALLAGRHEVLALSLGPCRLPPGRYAWADADLVDGRSVEAALRAFRAEAVLRAGEEAAPPLVPDCAVARVAVVHGERGG